MANLSLVARLLACLSVVGLLPPALAQDASSGFRLTILENRIEEKPRDERVLLSLVREDFECADTYGQRLLLSEAASARLLEALSVAGRVARREGDGDRAMTLKDVELRLYIRKFRVAVAGTEIYDGVFLGRASARLVNMPVARVNVSGQRLWFSILPLHDAFARVDPALNVDRQEPTLGDSVGSVAAQRNRARIRSDLVRRALAPLALSPQCQCKGAWGACLN